MIDTSRPSDVLIHTDFPELELHASGKVRDVYKVDSDHLLFVATDRISAFDYVLATGIPEKGRVLTQLSLFWFDFLKEIVPNHLATANVAEYPAELQKYASQLRGRSMLVVRADMATIECVVRGYISGSGWKEYKSNGSVCGIKLPAGLRESDKLPEPIFTPATKATSGHDENISFERMVEIVRKRTQRKAARPQHRHLPEGGGLCRDARHHHCRYEIRVWPDAKGLVLADEVLTPDSSRFWPMDKYHAGGAQESFDKQYVRDYLESIQWNKQPPAPGLPPEVAAKTSEKYIEAYTQLTGHPLPA